MRAAPATPATATPDRRRWRRRPAALVAGIVLLLMVLPGGGRAAAADAPGKVRVQYVSSGSVYLDAGQAAGLAEGTRLRVEREGRVVAELEVQFAAQHSAACKIVSGAESVQVGDVCSFTPA